jgi:ATP-dependent Clp protease adaptor protein ClpS
MAVETRTVPHLELDEDLLQKLLPPYNVILHNDDVHTFDEVARALNKVVGVSLKRGYELADIVHNNGNAIVATCRKEQAELYRERLEGYKLTVTIEPAE